jgi:hypothetical protein
MLVSLGFLGATYAFCRRFFSARAGVVAALLLLLDPGYLQWNLNARGGQPIDLLLNVLLLHVFYRMDAGRDGRLRWRWLFGFIAGFGYWNFASLLPLAAGLLLLLLLGRSLNARGSALLAAGAVVGSLPATLEALFGPSLPIGRPPFLTLAPFDDMPRRLGLILSRWLPALFSPWNGVNVVFSYCWGLLALTAAWMLYAAWSRRRGLPALARRLIAPAGLRPAEDDAASWVWPLLLYVAGYLAVAVVNRVGAREARYLLPIHPAVTILSAVGLTALLAQDRLPRALARLSLAAFLLVGLWVHADFLTQEPATNEDTMESRDRRHVQVVQIPNADMKRLIGFLDAKGIRCAYAANEIRSKIAFESGGRILSSNRYLLAPDTYLTPQYDYYPRHTEAMKRLIARGERPALVFLQDMALCKIANRDFEMDRKWRDLLEKWKAAGGTYREETVGVFVVYHDFWRPAKGKGA